MIEKNKTEKLVMWKRSVPCSDFFLDQVIKSLREFDQTKAVVNRTELCPTGSTRPHTKTGRLDQIRPRFAKRTVVGTTNSNRSFRERKRSPIQCPIYTDNQLYYTLNFRNVEIRESIDTVILLCLETISKKQDCSGLSLVQHGNAIYQSTG